MLNKYYVTQQNCQVIQYSKEVIIIKAYQFVVRDDDFLHRGEVLLTTSSLEAMYKEAKEAWESGSGYSIDDFYADRTHVLEAMIHESRKGKFVFIKTNSFKTR